MFSYTYDDNGYDNDANPTAAQVGAPFVSTSSDVLGVAHFLIFGAATAASWTTRSTLDGDVTNDKVLGNPGSFTCDLTISSTWTGLCAIFAPK